MKKILVICTLILAMLLCMVACDKGNTTEPNSTNAPTTQTSTKAPTTQAPTTQAPTTQAATTAPETEPESAPVTEDGTTAAGTEDATDTQPDATVEPGETTEADTTEPETTDEETTEEETTEDLSQIAFREQVKDAAAVWLEYEDIYTDCNNPLQDYSDFGGLTLHEDGTFTALFRMGTNDVWDPYFYLLKRDTTVGDILVIQYQCEYDFGAKLYMGTEGNQATGAGDFVGADLYATEEGQWNYLIIDMREEAGCYDSNSAALGYLRFGLDMSESGDTVTFGFVAFFNSMDTVTELIPQA